MRTKSLTPCPTSSPLVHSKLKLSNLQLSDGNSADGGGWEAQASVDALDCHDVDARVEAHLDHSTEMCKGLQCKSGPGRLYTLDLWLKQQTSQPTNLEKAIAVRRALASEEWEWALNLHLGLYLDVTAAYLILLVNIIAFLVHLFSKEYMKGDKSESKYYALLGFFTSSMIGLLLASDFITLFIGLNLIKIPLSVSK